MTDLIPRETVIAAVEEEADKCDHAVKWGGSRQYIANCKAASYALRNVPNLLRAIPIAADTRDQVIARLVAAADRMIANDGGANSNWTLDAFIAARVNLKESIAAAKAVMK